MFKNYRHLNVESLKFYLNFPCFSALVLKTDKDIIIGDLGVMVDIVHVDNGNHSLGTAFLSQLN